jgi:hypothetical protein
MNGLQLVTALSAAFGAGGSILILLGTYGFEPHEGAVWGSDAVTQANKEIDKRNKSRFTKQRAGIVLLLVAFLLQGLTAFPGLFYPL